MKKILASSVAAIAIAAFALGGCVTFEGNNGKDGQDLSIYDVYEATNAARREENLEELSFLEFVEQYFNYTGDEIAKAVDLQSVINRSLMSTVSIVSAFYKSGFSGSDPDMYAGSGVIVEIDKTAGSAYILTNCHVVYSDDYSYSSTIASEILVYLYGKEDFMYGAAYNYYGIEAEVVGASITYDLALLKVEDDELINSSYYAATFTDSDEVFVGQSVYAIGNAEGEGLAATIGIVSRDSEVINLTLSDKSYPSESDYNDYRVIRTDAAINGGNSGGGLYDVSGRLVGIVNSKTVGEEIENMGYVLPGSYAKRIAKLFRDGNGVAGSTGLNRCEFIPRYTYSSSAYYDPDLNVARIEDRVKLTSTYGDLHKGDILQKIRVLDGNKTVEEAAIKRYYQVDDILLSARQGYTVEYTLLRDEESVVVTMTATMSYCK